ncbi:MAG TPA: NUDIX domain-containing protein, partial [Verrucomicrobiae bacterium]
LDGNVIRVLTRIFGITENPKEKKTNARLWHLAEELVICANERWGETPGEPVLAHQRQATTAREDAHPTKDENCSHLNQSLMELGALVCTPRNPQCLVCPVKTLCVAFKESRTEELPNLGKRDAATARGFIAFAVEHNGRFLVQQRPGGVVNAQLWEFPNVEVGARLCEPQQVVAEFNALRVTAPRSEELKPLCTVKHSITRYRITLEAFTVSLKKSPKKTAGVWKTPAQMQTLAFTAAHKKLASAAAKSILSAR